MSTNSYMGKTFMVDNADARIRQENDLLQYVVYKTGDSDIPSGRKVGDPRVIPQGTEVKVTDAKSISNKKTFVLAEPANGVGAPYGWTSAANLRGGFINETIGQLPPPDNNKKGINAAWEGGTYLGQKTLVEIVGNENETERIILDNLDAYLALADAAAKDGVTVSINSGFRTYDEQELLYKKHLKDPKAALAAKPGFSNHQHGQAFDISVGGFEGHPVYDWLKKNGPKMGFIRTVNGEPWHWEYRPTLAKKMAADGQFKLAKVKQ